MGKPAASGDASRGSVAGFFARCARWGYRLASPKVRDRLAHIPGAISLYKRTFKPLLFAKASSEGLVGITFPTFVMYVDPKDTMGDMAMGEVWEAATTEVFKKLIRPGDVVVDVGAHWGYFTLLAATLCSPAGSVYSFEPHPRNFALLARNVAANHLPNVVMAQSAVSNCSGSIQMFAAQSSMGHSIKTIPEEWSAKDGQKPAAFSASAVSLDEYFAQTPLQPRLVKIDIEGAEPLAWAGMKSLMARHPSLVLILEFNPAYLDAAAAGDFLNQITAAGFAVAIIDDARRQLAVGSKAAVLNRFVEGGNVCNVLAARDPALFETMFQPQDGREENPGRLERVRL